MTALLPCPFCGRPPIINRIAPHTHNVFIKALSILPDHPGSVVIECACGCGLMDATEEAVAARWNQRTGAMDTARLDWLADRDNAIGQVLLPTECVTAHLDDMRAAIDAAMAMTPRAEGGGA